MFPTRIGPLVVALALVARLALAMQSEPPRRPFLIDLVDPRTHAAMAGAEVRWVELPPPGERDKRTLETRFAESRHVARAGPDGRVALDVGDGPISVRANRGRWYGQERFEVDSHRNHVARLALLPDRDVRVRVVDAAGRGVADVPVALRKWSTRSPADTAATQVDVVETRTDGDGAALLRHAGWHMEQERARLVRHDSGAPLWSAVIDTALATEVSAPVDVDHPTPEPLLLTLPETGSVVVTALDDDDQPAALAAPGFLAPAERDTDARTLDFCFQARDFSPRAAAVVRSLPQEGRVTFPFIGLGVPFVVGVRRNDASEVVVLHGKGPERAGATVKLRALLGHDGCTLQGRALSSGGVALANEEFEVELRLEPLNLVDPPDPEDETERDARRHHRDGGRLRTDGAGRFAFDTSADSTIDAKKGTRVVILARGRNRDDALEVWRELGAEPLRGTVDLGDVVVPPAPLLVAGRVVDPDGQPIAKATIEIGWTTRGVTPGIKATSAADGTFVLRGVAPVAALDLDVKEEHHDEASRTLPPGTRGALFVLPFHGGEVEGRIVVAAGTHPKDFTLTFIRDAGAADAVDPATTFDASRPIDLNDDATFLVAALAPGSWRMVVKTSLDPPLLEKSFTIRNAMSTDLGDVALPDATRVYRIAVKSAASGAPLAGGFLVRKRGEGRVEELLSNPPLHDFLFAGNGPRDFRDGTIRFVSTEPSFDVVVAAPGHRGAVVAAHPGMQEVVLAAALRVPLRIADFQGLPPEPCELRVRLALDADVKTPFLLLPREMKQLGWSSPFDAHGVAEVLVPGPGTWQVTWLVATRSGNLLVDWFEGREKSVAIGDEEPQAELVLHPERDTTRCGSGGR